MPQSNLSTQVPTAAAQIAAWTRTLDARRRTILVHRLGDPKDTQSLTQIASTLGITRERVRQIQNLIVRAFRRSQVLKTGSPAANAVAAIADDVGAAAPADHVARILARHGLTRHTNLIFQTAGPYIQDRGWLIRIDAAHSDPTPQMLRPADKPADAGQSFERLATWGLRTHLAMAWLNRTKEVRPIRGGLLPMAQSLNDRLVQSLTILAQPSTSSDILARIREQTHPRTTLNALSSDPRFIRTHKHKWGLVHWNNEVYTGCAAKMAETLQKQGPTPVKDLIASLSDRFGITPLTIKTHIRAPLFQIKNGTIFLCTPGTATTPKPLGTYPMPKGLFKNGRRRLTRIVEVTQETLRGSSVSLTKTAGKILELPAEATLQYSARRGIPVSVMINPTTTTGPILRSLRALLAFHKAEVGDQLVITLDSRRMTARTALVKPAAVTPGWETLSKLTGIPTPKDGSHQSPLTPLSRALMCQPEEVTELLTKRGDTHVIAAIPDTESN